MERFFQKMTPQHPFLRYNYFIKTDGELAWSSSIGPENIFGMEADTNKSNISIEEMYFRNERQTLTREGPQLSNRF
jgi:hypothetical protein